jgi:two-component sensor histidine kinase
MEHVSGSGRVAIRSGAYADLLRENESLRATVKAAENIAARHAALLREGDHRIKNSLQIVSSLMNMQAGREQSASAAASIRTAASRVHSIAQIHDSLQLGGGAGEIDLGDVLQGMCGALQDMAGEAFGVTIKVTAGRILLPIAIAQPVVLAVNELVLNSLRHGFPNGRGGVLEVIAAKLDGELRVTVADNGVGLPPSYDEGAGYGMKLVRMMVEQTAGELHIANRGGAAFMMAVPLADGGILPIEARTMASA